MDPKDLRYSATHEWARLEGDIVTIGVSKFAVDQLTDLVYVELPDVGDHIFSGADFGAIESVKAVSDLYAPVDGEVVAVNEPLLEDPTMIGKDPFGEGWLIKVRVEKGVTLDKLMTLPQYEKQIAGQDH
jgi:glycine cleavage system H protein